MAEALLRYLNQKNIINLTISFLPVSFIAGNLLINLNLLLIIFLSISFYWREIVEIKFSLFDKILILLFVLALITGLTNSVRLFESPEYIIDKNIFLKSFLFLRYLIFYFILKFLVTKEIFNFRFFFLSSSICVLFVSIDLIIQFFTGRDLFGYEKQPHKLSGPFGDEYIAGSYLQRFSSFLFFIFPFLINFKNRKLLILFLSLIFLIIFFSIIISGNRMPMILFILMFSTLFIIERKLWKYFLFFSFLSLLIFFLTYQFSFQVEKFTIHFIGLINQIFLFLVEFFQGKEPQLTNTYIKEFYSGYLAWKQNILFGGGIDSFYLNCVKSIEFCASHPHNYYLEILSELGIVGFFISVFIFFYVIYFTFIKRGELTMNFDKNLIYPFLLIFLVEVFPFKSTGSFFTTGNATFIFFILAVSIALSKKAN